MDFEEIEIKNCINTLKSGGTLLYPTDTIWGIGCDACNREAVAKIYRIKHREEDRSFIVLLEDASKLKDYVENVPPIALDLIEASVDSPLTIVYPRGKNLAENVMAKDGSIAIRIVNNPFCIAMLKEFGKPIVSSSANLSGDPSPRSFSEVSSHIISSVDHVAIVKENSIREIRPSRIIKIEDSGMFKVIRD